MEIQIVGVPGDPIYRSVENLIAAASAYGFTQTGVQKGTHLNASLQGLPTFKELSGPMGGGRSAQGLTEIRYETWEANRLLSS